MGIEKRFEIIYTQSNPCEMISILLDKETGQKYLVIDNEKGIALTEITEREQ